MSWCTVYIYLFIQNVHINIKRILFIDCTINKPYLYINILHCHWYFQTTKSSLSQNKQTHTLPHTRYKHARYTQTRMRVHVYTTYGTVFCWVHRNLALTQTFNVFFVENQACSRVRRHTLLLFGSFLQSVLRKGPYVTYTPNFEHHQEHYHL